MESKNRTVSIGEASRITGATVRQIRFWEGQGYIPEPGRVVCGQRAYRQYGPLDLEAIALVKRYLVQGYTLMVAGERARCQWTPDLRS